ncbi:MAG: hypothetical protein ACMVY4_19010 [Minwuia sp.]|uniref:hypothetical protein n=1 Tax=Minwuia sp. TaxID=2493630 RepID=UPI003A8A8408
MGHYEPKILDTLMAMADAGDRDAQYRIGLIYATESGEAGLIHAHKWFNIAATAGDARARAERQEMAEMMSAAQIAEAQKMARAWMSTRAA